MEYVTTSIVGIFTVSIFVTTSLILPVHKWVTNCEKLVQACTFPKEVDANCIEEAYPGNVMKDFEHISHPVAEIRTKRMTWIARIGAFIMRQRKDRHFVKLTDTLYVHFYLPKNLVERPVQVPVPLMTLYIGGGLASAHPLFNPWHILCLAQYAQRYGMMIAIAERLVTPEHNVEEIYDVSRDVQWQIVSGEALRRARLPIQIDKSKIFSVSESAGTLFGIQDLLSFPQGTFRCCFVFCGLSDKYTRDEGVFMGVPFNRVQAEESCRQIIDCKQYFDGSGPVAKSRYPGRHGMWPAVTFPVAHRFMDIHEAPLPIDLLREFEGTLDIDVIMFHGTKDRIVPYQQAVVLRDELQRKGAKVRMISWEGQDHCGHYRIDCDDPLVAPMGEQLEKILPRLR